MSSIIDTYITYRILTTLTKDWDEQEAYKLGIIDKRGNVLKKTKELKTSKEKKAYTILTKFIFNLKKLIEKLPGGKSKAASYAAAAYLFRGVVPSPSQPPPLRLSSSLPSLSFTSYLVSGPGGAEHPGPPKIFSRRRLQKKH